MQNNIGDIFEFFKTTSFELTINKCALDETRESERDIQLSDIEETVLFRTIQPDYSFVDGPQSSPEHVDDHRPMSYGTWAVFPTALTFDMRTTDTQHLTIRNNFARPQTFQVTANVENLFSMSMMSGCIESCREAVIDVTLKSNAFIPANVMLTVYIESDAKDVPVHIAPARPRH